MGWKTPEQQRAYERSPERLAKRRERDRQRYRTEKRKQWVKDYNKSEKYKEYKRKHMGREDIKKARKEYRDANRTSLNNLSKKWYRENLSRAREIQKEFRARHRFAQALHCSRNAARKRGHVACNATKEEIESRFTGKCQNPACEREESSLKRRLSLDHCHKTGMFRGWLCASCNRALGLVKDSPAILRGLTVFLKKAEARGRKMSRGK